MTLALSLSGFTAAYDSLEVPTLPGGRRLPTRAGAGPGPRRRGRAGGRAAPEPLRRASTPRRCSRRSLPRLSRRP